MIDLNKVKKREHHHKKDTFKRTFLTLCYYKYIQKRKDLFVLIEQDKGSGKSTLAIRLAEKWVQILKELGHQKVPFSYEENIIYDDDLQSIMDKIKSLPKFSPLIFDEGGRIILAEDWNKKENKALKKMFAEIRTKQLFVIICSPFAIDEIDKKYKKNFLHFWVHLWGFGFATVFRKNLHPLRKGFHEDNLLDILPEFVDYVDTPKQFYRILKFVSKHECYYQPLFWSPLTEKAYEKYQKKRDKAVYEDSEKVKAIPKKKKDKFRQYKLVKLLREKGLQNKEIAKELNLSNSGFNFFVHTCKKEFDPESLDKNTTNFVERNKKT